MLLSWSYLWLVSMYQLHVVMCAESVLDAVFWEVKPYMFINERGEMDGVYPMIFRQATTFCLNQTVLEHYNAEGLISFHKFNMSSRREFLTAYKSKNKLSGVRQGRDIWMPIFARDNEELQAIEIQKNYTNFDISTAKELAIIVRRDWISLPNKILRGILSCGQILLLTALLTILFGLLIWICEGNTNEQFPDNSVNGIGVGIWWSLVSMTTVGYGDVVPKTIAGRCIAIIWVCVGVMIICVTTATVTEIVNGISDLKIHGQRISVLEESFESEKAEMFGAKIVEMPTYEEVLRAVRDGEVFAAAMSTDIAAWRMQEINDDSQRYPLRVVKKLPAILNLNIAFSNHFKEQPYLKDIIRCMKKMHTEVYDRSVTRFTRYYETETIYIGSFLDLFRTTLVQVVLGGIVLFFCIGVVFNTNLLGKHNIPLRRNIYNNVIEKDGISFSAIKERAKTSDCVGIV